MIIIRFGRYAPTLEVKSKNGINYNVFQSLVDHSIIRPQDQMPIDRALHMAHKWLEDHFGFVIIELCNKDENDSPICIRLCNYKKFVKTLHSMNCEVSLKNHITA